MKFSNIWISHSTFLNHWRVSLFKKEFDENINNNQDSLGFWEVFNEKISVTINPFWTKLTNIILNFKISLLTYALQTSTLQVCFNPFRECDNISVKSSLIPIEKLLKFEQIKSVRVFDVSFVRFDYAQIYLFSVTASLEGIDWCNDTFLCPWKNSQCENTFGSYLCKCKNGWILGDDKSSCVELASPLEKSTIVISLPVSILVPLLIVIIIVVSVWIYRKKIKSQPILNTDISQSENYLDCKRQDSRKTADKWEIYPKTINIDKKIGEGAFGNVFIAKISSNIVAKTCYGRTVTGSVFLDIKDDFCINVAVKFLKDHANQLELNDFVEEINLMKGIGYHKNIVNMIGCSTLQKPLCLVVEFMENGDLLQFLKNSRAKLITSKVYKESSINFNSNYQNMPEKINSNSEVVSVDDNERVTPNDLINFAWQVASGMEYLSSIKLVHRDLAARNILVGADKIVKISDFGLTRKVNADLNYMGSNNRRLPIKWMSVEAIFDRTFTTYSDVWAYGIVLFEIVTLGGTPYPTISNRELLPLLKTGYRMERPDNCSQSMFDCMLKCWNEDPLQRPTFTKLCELFEELMSQSGNYFSLKIDEESTYYKVPSFHSNSNDFNDLV
ncbi:fibroblast growth factor receptor 3-like isoform X3 [Hydra vulgaris]|uniref:Fibroblast growth factor receptor 3-like isoform X3 n=1 Tax=Hydra vulgaris TaxID=6087 RepID=A0ABM4C7N5_HYDVU